MKKITLLFATMLAMSGMAFGQKEGKVILKKDLEIPYLPLKTISYSVVSQSSPNGNSVVINTRDSNGSAYLLDKNGKKIFSFKNNEKIENVFFYFNKENNIYNLLYCYHTENDERTKIDSIVFLNENYERVKNFDLCKKNSFLKSMDDGILYNDSLNKLTKYNVRGLEEWSYINSSDIELLNDKPPYLMRIDNFDKSSILIIDKNGVKKGLTTEDSFFEIYPTNDEGFWIITSNNREKKELVKYDSFGKETCRIKYKDLNLVSDNLQTMSDNSLVLSDFINQVIYFLKIEANGNVKRTNRENGQIKISNPIRYINLKVINEGVLMYSITYDSLINLSGGGQRRAFTTVVGQENLNFENLNWHKNVASSFDRPPNIEFQTDDGGLFQVSYIDLERTNVLKYIKLDGVEKWIYKNTVFPFYQVKKINQLVYVYSATSKYYLYLLDYKNGNVLLKKDNILMSLSDIKEDKLGNQYIKYSDPNCFETNCAKENLLVFKKDGTLFWQYSYQIFIGDNLYSGTIENSLVVNENGTVSTLNREADGNSYKYILRKISPCNDLNAISITGKTEACPTEKVKLSIQKEEGLTYQWQKDGKDIPNTKDVVYDFGESGTYTVIAKDELCGNSVTSNVLKLTIRPLPSTEITAPKSVFCDGEKVTIASKTNGTFFQWQKDGKDIPNATTGIYEVSQAGDYRVGVRDDKCPQVGYSNIYTIITKLLPEANISTDIKGVVYEPFTVKMSANSGTGLAYQWLKDDVIIPDETKAIYEAKKSGKYTVNVTYDGCTKRSDALTISILIPLSNQEEIGEETVQVYPNPNKGEFKIILPKSLKSADVQLFDTFGRERSLMYVGEQAQADGLVQGVYFLRIQKGERSVVNKIVIE